MVDLFQTRRLLSCALHDGDNVAVDLLNLLDDLFQRLAGLPDQRDAALDLLAGCIDQRLDLLGRLGRTLRQFTHFLGNDGKTLAGIPRARRLHASVQRQEIGLEGDIVDDADDVGNFARRVFDLSHGRDGIAHHRSRALGIVARCGHQMAGLLCPAAGIGDGRGDLFQRCSRFLDGCRLLFGALRQVIGSGPDFRRTGGNRLGIGADRVHGQPQLFHRIVEIVAHLFHGRHKGLVEILGEIAIRQTLQGLCQRADSAHALRHIRCKLDDLADLSLVIDDRIIGRLDPDLLAALAEAQEFVGGELTTSEPLPELPVFLRLHIGGIAEHPVMPPLNFLQLVPQRPAEILVGGENLTCRREFDHRLRTRDCIQLAGILHGFLPDHRDIGCKLHHLVGLAAAQHRIVGGLDPDFPSTLGEALILLPVEFAAAEPGPEFPVFDAVGLRRFNENTVMLALDLRQLIAQCRAEIGIGVEDIAAEVEFDDRLRLVHRSQNSCGVTAKTRKKPAHTTPPSGNVSCAISAQQ